MILVYSQGDKIDERDEPMFSVLCGVGVDISVHHHVSGFYILVATLILFFLEIAWVIGLFLKVCIRDEYSTVLSCWEGVLWIKEWRKTVIYVIFAAVLIIRPNHLWLSSVAGVMLIILGLLHLLHHWGDRARGYTKEPLMDNQDSFLDSCDINDTDNSAVTKDQTAGDILNNNELDNNKLETS
ncbi:UNVERIFIED_CONTAM: hypothetical protein PYX00_002017 [Menopon gallinae]|uniref:Transmembrane protein 72 n=1 Tax=Menopon gallinae TaxID=328185 RepID=A0AAW2IF04_9NEOP